VTPEASVALQVSRYAEGPPGRGLAQGADDFGGTWCIVLPHAVLPRAPRVGERWRFAGELEINAPGDRRLKATVALPLTPSGQGIVQYLATNPQIVGVGRAYAQRLWDRYGEHLYEVLRTRDAAALSRVVGPFLAASIVQGWGLYLEEVEAFAWLDACGVAPRTAAQAIELWGTDVQRTLADDPYALCLLEPWTAVDRAALRAGAMPDDDHRLLAAVEEASARRYAQKHTASTLDELRVELLALLGRDSTLTAGALELAIKRERLVDVGGGSFQTRGPREMERVVRGALLERAARAPLQVSEDEFERAIKVTEDELRCTLHDLQRAAVRTAVTNHLSALSGGAGTGKTTTLRAIVAAAEACEAGGAVLQVALSGRAAKRMAEATGRPALTVHRFLLELHARRLRADNGLLVLDEASMLDLPSVYSIVRAVGSSLRLLFVGDPAQLPPIGPGLVFHRLAASGRLARVELTALHRQTLLTGIPQVASRIRRGSAPRFRAFNIPTVERSGVFLHAAERGTLTRETLRVLEALTGNPVPDGVHERDIQILCATRRGDGGTQALNGAVEALLHPRDALAKHWGFALGSKILWTTNDHRRGTPAAPRSLLNGALGRIVGVERDRLQAQFDDGTVDELDRNDLAKVDRGWAITVHKAQGSAFRHVIIPVATTRLLDRMLVYTAVTRATHLVVLVGEPDVLRAAIESAPRALQRRVALHFDDAGSPPA
jgi:exodeoxyribonuclease V alpha subunit